MSEAPDPRDAPAAPDTWREVVLMSDERVTSIPVVEDGSALVDVGEALRFTGDTPASRLLRAPVLDRLVAADAALRGRTQQGLRIALNEGYRPPALQRHYFERYRERLRASDPKLDEASLHRLASRFVSPPEIAPHSAGAALDVLLVTDDGEVVDVGCPINASPEQSDGTCYTAHPAVVGEQRRLRDLLADALTDAGLVNYPTEWWHWSFGDRYWAHATGSASAPYGAVEDRDGHATGPGT